MSSHHFVKENQEPALLLLDTSDQSFKTIAPLLEWVPTVLVSQSEVWCVISWGIKIDVILADLEFQQANYHLLEEQYPVKFLGVSEGNFLEEGLQYLVATKHSAVNIIGLAPWEIPRETFSTTHLDMVLWHKTFRHFPVRNGHFKKWFPAGKVSLYCDKPMSVSVKTGHLESEISSSGSYHLSVPEGTTEFQAKEAFWLGEEMG